MGIRRVDRFKIELCQTTAVRIVIASAGVVLVFGVPIVFIFGYMAITGNWT